MQKLILSTLTAVLLIFSGNAVGQFDLLKNMNKLSADSQDDGFSASIIANKTAVAAGGELTVAVEINIADGWVYYAPNQTEDIVIPAGVKINTSPAWKILETRWQVPEIKATDLGDKMVDIAVYKKHAWLFVTFMVSPEAKGISKVSITPTGQVCKDVCKDIPQLEKSVEVTVSSADVANTKWTADIAERFKHAKTLEQLRGGGVGDEGPTQIVNNEYASWSLAWALLVAFIAGLTLNIMPCVLPVLPLRILSVVDMAGQSRRKYVTMGLAFAAGIMLFFVGIAVVNVILKLTLSRAIDINEAFQHRWVMVGLIGVLVVLCANLFGLFDVNAPHGAGKWESKISSGKAGHAKSLGMGLMLAVLATPCSFAFLAAALAYAQTAGVVNGTAVILVIGIGMALPHAILAGIPKLIDYLPRPGRWMELFRQGCGFALLGAVVWLVSTQGGDGSGWAFRFSGWLVVLMAGVWVWGKWVSYNTPKNKKLAIRFAAIVFVAVSGYWLLQSNDTAGLQYRPFDLEQITQARDRGETVVVKFTARWCLKCIELEREVYENPKIVKTIENDAKIQLFKGDITTADLPAARWMKANGYGSRIPLTIIYRPEAEPVIVVGGYTPEQLLDWIRAPGDN